MSLNPFQINNVIETRRFPLARFKRRPLFQKFKDTFVIFGGTLDEAGLIDWLTLFIPKIASFILIIPLFILLGRLSGSFPDDGDPEQIKEKSKLLSWLSIAVLAILSIPAVLFVPPLFISWLIISSALTIISMPIVTLVHAIFYKNQKPVLEEIRFEDGKTLQNFMDDNHAEIENLHTDFLGLDDSLSYNNTFNLLTASEYAEKYKEKKHEGYQLRFWSGGQTKRLYVKDEETHKSVVKLCELNIGQISSHLENTNNLATFLDEPLPVFQNKLSW
ncbi:MAG: hypothetical protein Q8M03_06215 [Legionella sp.]|nr:hypothetical protein [Legionella sp.]